MFLFNLRYVNKQEQIGEEFERNEKLNSVDFYNFDRQIFILISFVFNLMITIDHTYLNKLAAFRRRFA